MIISRFMLIPLNNTYVFTSELIRTLVLEYNIAMIRITWCHPDIPILDDQTISIWNISHWSFHRAKRALNYWWSTDFFVSLFIIDKGGRKGLSVGRCDIVRSLANPNWWEMNGSDPGVIRQLTEIVIATRQPRTLPTLVMWIWTRPSRATSLGKI